MLNNITQHKLKLIDDIRIEYDTIRFVVGDAVYFSKDGIDIAYINCPEVVGRKDTLSITNLKGTIPFTFSEN